MDGFLSTSNLEGQPPSEIENEGGKELWLLHEQRDDKVTFGQLAHSDVQDALLFCTSF